MTTVAEALDALRRSMEDGEGCPILRWHEDGADESRFFNDVAAELAAGYSQGRYSYEFGDFAANALWATYLHSVGHGRSEIPYPALAISVFEAFDAGELASAAVPDPVSTYTDPEIAAIVSKL